MQKRIGMFTTNLSLFNMYQDKGLLRKISASGTIDDINIDLEKLFIEEKIIGDDDLKV